jgi:hypothetical protein
VKSALVFGLYLKSASQPDIATAVGLTEGDNDGLAVGDADGLLLGEADSMVLASVIVFVAPNVTLVKETTQPCTVTAAPNTIYSAARMEP